MKKLMMLVTALVATCGFASVDLDSPYFRFDFSSGSLSLTGTGEANIGSSTGLRTGTYTAVGGPCGAGTAVHPGGTNWGEVGDNALLNADWTFVMTIRPGTIEDGVILSLGRAPSGGKQISVCSSSDKSKIYVRVPYRTSSGDYTSEETCAELTGLGDVTLGFHTLVIAHQYDSSNNGTLYFYWDGVAKGSYTTTCGLPFAGSSNPGMQFCTTISSGSGTFGDYSYVQTSGSNFKYYAYYDVRLYTEMFDASDAVAYDTAIRSTFTTPDYLLHRWSFNGDFDDSIGGTTATTNGAVSFDSDSEKLCLAGGSKGSSYIDLGSYPIPGDVDDTPFTIETWVTPQTIYNWSACFWLGRSSESDFGLSCVFKNGSYGQPHFRALNATLLNQQSETAVNEANCRLGSSALSAGTDYHIALTVTPKGNGNGSTVAMYIHDTSGNLVVSGWATYRDWTTAMLNQDYFWLGQSCWNDYNPAADYDEVRVWRVALTEDQIVASIKAGPDTLPDFSVPSGFPSGITAIDDVDAYVSDGLLMHLDGIRNVGADAEHDSTATGWTDLVQGDLATFNSVSNSSAVSSLNWADDGYNFAGDSYAQLGHSLTLPKAMTVQLVSEIDVDELESAYSSSAWIRYPAPIGSTDTGDKFVMYYHCDNNNFNIKIENSNLGKQIAAADWRGEYETYWNNGTNGGLFQETLCPPARSNAWSKTTTRTVTIGASNGGTLTTGGTTYNGYQARALTGKIQAARIYSRALTDDELKWNRLVDNVRFKGVLPECGVVMVATDLDGAEGTDASGTYYVSGSHTFGVESETVTVGDVGYTLVGYTLERFNTAAGTWCSPVTYDETSFAYTNNVQSGSVRLTWNWKKTLRPVSEIDVGDYVQNGLIAHFDGIRNAGAANDHDSTTRTWTNLADGPDATFKSGGSTTTSGSWTDTGFSFTGAVYAQLTNSFSLGKRPTLQFVTDIDCTNLTTRYSGVFHAATADWGIYLDRSSTANCGWLRQKMDFPGPSTRPNIAVWGGKYLTSVFSPLYYYVTEGTTLPTDSSQRQSRDWTSSSYKAPKYQWTWSGSPWDSESNRYITGTYYAVRIYSRELSAAELAHNRQIDEIRFRGNSADYASVTVGTSCEGVNGNESGAYILNGSYTFSAPATNTVDDVVYLCSGYLLEQYDDSDAEWKTLGAYDDLSFTYTNGTARTRITWLWRKNVCTSASDFDVGDYVLDGLIINFDGIRNAGATNAHDSTATTWKNLGTLGSDCDATKCQISDSYLHDSAADGEWDDYGYYFKSKDYFKLDNAFSLGTNGTTQVVADYDCYAQKEFYSSSGVRWPHFFGCIDAADWYNVYVNISGSSQAGNRPFHKAHNNGNTGSTDSWDGRYANGILTEGETVSMYASYSNQTAWVRTDNANYSGGEIGSHVYAIGIGGNNSEAEWSYRILYGKVRAVRVYDRVLTDDEFEHNRKIDEIRFFGGFESAAHVTVETNREGFDGNESGAYFVNGSYTFTSEASKTVDDVLYLCCGYVLEEYNESTDTWDYVGTYSDTSYTYTNDGTTGRVRITWQWKKNLCTSVDDYGIDDYVKDGLIIHFDGIRNAGATNAHDSTATTWKNLGTLGSACDATKCSLSSDYLHGNAADGEWDDYGYYFKSKDYFLLDSAFSLGTNGTTQVVADYDCYVQKEFYTASGDSSRIVKWPHFFGCIDAADWYNVYVNVDGSSNQGNRPFHKAHSNGNNASTDSWDGRYATGILTEGETISMYASYSNQTAWVRTDNANYSAGEIGSHVYAIGTGGNNSESEWGYRILYGKVRAVRVYNRVLTEEEIEKNHKIDEMRFFGGTFADNADVTVAIDTTGAAVGETAEAEGPYGVNGSYTFTASTVVTNGTTYYPAYTLSQRVNGVWYEGGLVPSGSYTYTEGDGTVLLTWTWTPQVYNWVGESGGSFSDTSNWDPEPSSFDSDGWFAFTNTTAISVTMDADTTIGTLYFIGSAAVTLANPDSATTNTLTVTDMSNSMSVSPTINCAVQFADTYYVECTSAAINFAGGATATYPDPAMTNCTEVARALTGKITFTADWTPAESDLSPAFTVPDGSELYGQSLYAANVGSGQIALRILEGGYAEFEDVTVDDNRMQVSTWGHLKVNGIYSAGYGGYTYAGIGLSADSSYSGIVEANGIRKNSGWPTYLRLKTVYVGSDGIGVTKSSYNFYFDTVAKTIYASDDFSVTSPIRDGYPEDWRIDLNSATTFNTQGHTVTWTAGGGGSAELIKDGDGTLMMSPHNNIMTGTATVNAGTLEIGSEAGVGYKTITVASGATLKVNSEAAGAFTNAVTLADGAILSFNVDDTTLNGSLSNVTIADSATATLNLEGTIGSPGTSYTLITNMTEDQYNQLSITTVTGVDFTYEDGSLIATVRNRGATVVIY